MGKRILIGAVAAFVILAILGSLEEANEQPDEAAVAETSTNEVGGVETTPTTGAEREDRPTATTRPAPPQNQESTPPQAAEDDPGIDPGIDTAELDAVISDLDDLLGDLTSSFNQTEGDMQP